MENETVHKKVYKRQLLNMQATFNELVELLAALKLDWDEELEDRVRHTEELFAMLIKED